MKPVSISKKKIFSLLATVQVLVLFSYLMLNITRVGEMGVALHLLAGFVALSVVLFVAQFFDLILALRLHLFIFLILILWISLRVIVDLGDFEHLKALTIATTGGMLLFFLVGTFARQALSSLTQSTKNNFYPKFLLVSFTTLFLFIFVSFKSRLLERSDIFYIAGVDGDYQRSGNFMIMLFIMASFAYLSIAASFKTKSLIRLITWLGIYSIGTVLALISSQMIGSNAATANLLAIYMMTAVISILAVSTKIRQMFLQDRLSLPLSKAALRKLVKYSGIALVSLLLLAAVAIQTTGFDLSKTRVFGFGSGSNSSIDSRFDILLETGAAQMGYAPFMGNVNVAELTTGNAGRTLHNFLPNVMAELGLVGLILVLLLFYLTFRTLINNVNTSSKDPYGFKVSIINFWLFYILVFLFLYANISVGKEWPVMWFFVGIAGDVFVFNKRQLQS